LLRPVALVDVEVVRLVVVAAVVVVEEATLVVVVLLVEVELAVPVEYPTWKMIPQGPGLAAVQDAPALLETSASNPAGVPWSVPWAPYLVQ
jgi:hypothetical protein